MFLVAPADLPTPTAVPVNSTALNITLSRPLNPNGIPSRYEVYVQAPATTAVLAYNGSFASNIIVGDLMPFTNYSVWAKFYNTQFPSSPAISSASYALTEQAGMQTCAFAFGFSVTLFLYNRSSLERSRTCLGQRKRHSLGRARVGANYTNWRDPFLFRDCE